MKLYFDVVRRPYLAAAGLAAVVAVVLLAVVSPARGLEDFPWYGSSTAGVDGDEGFEITADGQDGPAQLVYDWTESPSLSEEFVLATANEIAVAPSIDWEWTGSHGLGSTQVRLEAFYYDGPVESTLVLVDTAEEGGFHHSGNIAFEPLGGEYGFRVVASNLDGGRALGTLTLEGFSVDVLPTVAAATPGDVVPIEAFFTTTGDGQPLDALVGQISGGLSYVPGSSVYLDPFGGPPISLDDPAVSPGGGELTWTDVEGFSIDQVYGLGIGFDVLVEPDYVDYQEAYVPAVVKVFGRIGGFEAGGSGSFSVDPPPEPESRAEVVLLQAVPLAGGTQSGIVGQLHIPDTDPGESVLFDGALIFRYSDVCEDGVLVGDGGAEPSLLGYEYLEETANGGAILFALALPNLSVVEDGYLSASFAEAEASAGPYSPCIAIGPDNTSWTRALPVPLTSGTGSSEGYIDQPGTGRWFKFAVAPGAQATVTMSGLPEDYDLAVFKDIQQTYDELASDVDVNDLHKLSAEFAPSVFSPSVFSPSVFSPSVFSPDAYSPSVFSPSVFSPSVFSPVELGGSGYAPSVFSPDVFASAQTRSIVGVSANKGTGDEIVVANTWTNTGEYYIRVTGRNGVFDVEQQFDIQVTLDDTTCDVGSLAVAPSVRAPVASSADTVVLWDSNRIEGDSAPLSASLAALAARPEVDGVIIDLAADTNVSDLRAQAAAQTGCVYATNLVAESIKGIVDSYRNAELEYVVLVGGDDSIPFFRYPDQALLGPEQDYEPPVSDDSASQASLRLNYILGQDEYGAAVSVSSGDGSIPIPDLAVGRLVETAAEATGVIDAYLSDDDGVVLSGNELSTLTTGYDFLTDSALEVADSFDAGTGGTGDRLIDPADRSPADPLTWTADDFRSALFGPGRIDLAYLAGHFSANSALAADYETSIITTELAASTTDFTNAIVFSGGCHSGYNIVNGEVVPGVTLDLDWAQAFAQKGATLIAGTGYQYGDTDFVEYSERLYAGFADELRAGTGPVAVGQALVEAKHDYLETTPEMTGLHRKSFIISTVFGLPMISVDLPEGRGAVDDSTSVIGALSSFTADPGDTLGLEFADVELAGALIERLVPLTPLDGSSPLEAIYYEGPNGVVTNPAQPVIPLISENVSVDGMVLRGVGFRGGAFNDLTGTEANPLLPLTGAPTTELRGVHTPFASERFFPLRIATANNLGELTGQGRGTVLNVTPAQHRVETIGDLNAILRLYSDVDLRLYYSSNTADYGGVIPALSAPPSITNVAATANGSDVDIEVFVVGDPAAGIQEVWVTYTHSGVSQWIPLDLTQDPSNSTRWLGTIAGGNALGSLEFIAQAVNGVGLVAIDDSFGDGFATSVPAIATDPTDLAVTSAGSGAFGDSASVSATLTSFGTPVGDATVLFTLGGTTRAATTDGAGIATADLPLTSVPGSYDVTASFAGNPILDGSTDQGSFTIAKAVTALTLEPAAATILVGDPTGLAAKLTVSGGGPLNERTVFFTVANAVDTQTVPVITTVFGVASLGSLDLPAGEYTVTAQFLGPTPYPAGEDEIYEASSDTVALIIEEEAAGPDTDGDGIPDDLDDDDDNDGITDVVEIEIGSDPLVTEVGRQFKQAVRSYLSGLEGSRLTEIRLRRTGIWLGFSLHASYWVDDDTLDLRRGLLVFTWERLAALELQRIAQSDPILAPEVTTALRVLTFVDRQLAQTLLDEAIVAGGDGRYLDKAQVHLDAADAYADVGHWDKAIREYGRGWKDASRALG